MERFLRTERGGSISRHEVCSSEVFGCRWLQFLPARTFLTGPTAIMSDCARRGTSQRGLWKMRTRNPLYSAADSGLTSGARTKDLHQGSARWSQRPIAREFLSAFVQRQVHWMKGAATIMPWSPKTTVSVWYDIDQVYAQSQTSYGGEIPTVRGLT